MLVIKANKEDHHVLTEITKRSKAYWGYPDELMQLWADLLTITPLYIEEKEVYKLLLDDVPIGYYAYFTLSATEVKLDNLFVLPGYIGKGFGKLLMDDFFKRVKKDFQKVILDSEPYAELFYAKLGFVKTGELETRVKDRYLPIMELVLTKK